MLPLFSGIPSPTPSVLVAPNARDSAPARAAPSAHTLGLGMKRRRRPLVSFALSCPWYCLYVAALIVWRRGKRTGGFDLPAAVGLQGNGNTLNACCIRILKWGRSLDRFVAMICNNFSLENHAIASFSNVSFHTPPEHATAFL